MVYGVMNYGPSEIFRCTFGFGHSKNIRVDFSFRVLLVDTASHRSLTSSLEIIRRGKPSGLPYYSFSFSIPRYFGPKFYPSRNTTDPPELAQ